MKSLDKKIISALLILAMIFPIFSNLSVYATDSDFVEIQNEEFKQSLLKVYDTNKDGKLSQEEANNIKELYANPYSFDNETIKDLVKFKNVEKIVLGYNSSSYTKIDVSVLSKLAYFFIYGVPTDLKLELNVPDNIVLNTYNVQDGKKDILSANISSVKKTLYVNECIRLLGRADTSLYISSDPSVITVIGDGDPHLQAKKVGKAKITFKSDYQDKEVEITVINSNNNPNLDLKTNCESTKLYYNLALTESGDLYKADVKNPSTMKKVDTNVKSVASTVYTFRQGATAYIKDNVLNYEVNLYNETNPTKKINNVKSVVAGDGTGGGDFLYITTNNELYQLYYNANGIGNELIDTNVSKTEGYFYVKDGATYCYKNKEKVAEFAFDSAYMYTIIYNNSAYIYDVKFENQKLVGTLNKKLDGVKGFYKASFNDKALAIELEDGTFKETHTIKDISDISKVSVQCESLQNDNFLYDLNHNYVLFPTGNLNYNDDVVLSNVTAVYSFNKGIIICRKDGSVYYQENPYEKLTCILENTKSNNKDPEPTPTPNPTPTPDPTPTPKPNPTPSDKNDDKKDDKNNNQQVEKTYTTQQVADLLFDATYYANKYPDLKAAFGYDANALRNHWLTSGIKEGRQASVLFDANYYLNNNSDLKNAFGSNKEAAYNHFITCGYKELRKSSSQYWGYYYKTNNSDLKNMDAYSLMEHYKAFGVKENRRANEEIVNLDENVMFDADLYASLYSDLRAAFGNNVSALKNHWLTCGIKEGRIGSLVFDAKYYLNKYSDLKKAFGTNYEAAYNHFKSNGIKEGRVASSFFDVNYYLNNNADLKKAFGTDAKGKVKAINHFYACGIKEGRNASGEFKLSVYKNYADLKKAFGNNNIEYYKHYISFGKREGRNAK